jgi:ribosome-associated translation inhibitor RaiA
MEIRVSSPGTDLKTNDVERIHRDLDKIARRLNGRDDVTAEVRIQQAPDPSSAPGFRVVVELDYGRNHLIAKAHDPDLGFAVRAAREELLRQINDRSRRGHSWFTRRLTRKR